MSLMDQVNQQEMDRVTAMRPVPEFSPGDTVKVMLKVIEGTRERLQAYEGVCIARKNDGVNSSFTVRKMSGSEGVERVLPLYSPNIASIEVMRHGKVRRAKLFYLRELTGKKARIPERKTGRGMQERNKNIKKKASKQA